MHFPDHEPPCEFPLTSSPDGVVLDTNVVLDWLLFDDPAVSRLVTALTAGHVRWLATTPMRGELQAVLERGLASARGADTPALLARWDALAHIQPLAPVHVLRCADADDQKFFDLAVAAGARWLFSRDRALLKLGRRARALGLRIVTPQGWPGPSTSP